MCALKTRSIDKIERKMEGIEEDSIRRRVLMSAKNFKTSWIELGQSLYSVWKDKLYRDWGYIKFDAYTSKEIGIKKDTALKLLRSYYFLESEDPRYLQKEYSASSPAASMPGYEAVNVLRLAKSKKALDRDDYFKLKREVLDMGKDAREVKKDLTALIKQREELEPDEARKRRRVTALKRFLTILKTLKRELEISKFVPSDVIKETAHWIEKIELELD